MSDDLQESIDVRAGEKTRLTRIGGPPIHRGVHWLSPWWRTWDAMKPTFAHHAYDPSALLEDNIHKAATDFQEERPWPHARGEERTHSSWRMWEQFRLVVGLSYRPVVPRLACEDVDDEDVDSDYEDPPPRKPSTGVRKHRVFRGVGAFYEEADDKAAERGMTPHEQWLRHTAEMGDNMAHFILDAEKVLRFLFSAYFYHHGLITTGEACYCMPVIASYFLHFLIRHLDLDKYDKSMFERALAVAELARIEMPLIYDYTKSFVIARDVFSIFCRATFGELPLVHGDLVRVASSVSISSLATDDSGAHSSTSDVTSSLPSTPAQGHFVQLPFLSIREDLISDEDPWTLRKPSLPLPDLSITHIRGIVEASVRRIVGVFPPGTWPSANRQLDGTVERVLAQTSWSVELAPQPDFRSWRSPDWEAWPGYETASLRIAADGRDSRDTPIRLLVSPDVGTALARCPGMILCGDFAELVPRTGSKGEVWYLHQFVGLGPSFYEPDRPEE